MDTMKNTPEPMTDLEKIAAHLAIELHCVQVGACNSNTGCYCREQIDEVRRALNAAGFAIVPREPTREMSAAIYAIGKTSQERARMVIEAGELRAEPPTEEGN